MSGLVQLSIRIKTFSNVKFPVYMTGFQPTGYCCTQFLVVNSLIFLVKMKTALKVFLVALAIPTIMGMSDEMQELANQLHTTCIGETGAAEDAITNARNGDFSEADSFKCYIKCLLSQMAIIDDNDGTIDVDAMVAVLPEEIQEATEPIIRKCGSIIGANPCDSAWLTHKCYYKEGPEINHCIMLILPAIRALSDEMKELAQMLHNTCVAETGVNEDFIRKVNAEKIFADDENLKCYIKCLMAQMACIDDDGIIDEEATIAILPEEYQALAAPVIRACGTKHGANPCENAWLSHRCYAEMEPSAYMLI
ncbi:uncharacterized protein LOC109537273 [Dendroctonus ponderosae]|uniref:uncharacterized protein LOC109537273 n=1 Tax=Dendroctonus ponderosae TaxID=77166 RepID=UPI002034F108|nr:uncharacterized protein LOC109537273 [Dendroctonus ponderosae]